MRTFAALIGVLALAVGAAGDEPKKADAPKPNPPRIYRALNEVVNALSRPRPTVPKGTPAEQVKAIIREYDEAAAAFMKRYNKAVTDKEQEKLFDQYFPMPDDYAIPLLEIAEKHAKDPAAIDALIWAAQHGSRPPNKPDSPFARAKKALVRDHLNSPRIGPFCMALRYDTEDLKSVEVLRRVWTRNPDKKARAQAGFALAKLLRQRAGYPKALRELTPKQVESWEKAYGKEVVAALRRIDADAERKEAEQVLEKLTRDKDYAATETPRGDKKMKVGELAEAELFEVRHLLPGKPAPEIKGEDVDGKKFKLSDYKGKVVLLDFWGHW
jgi:hypothetical protein